MSWCGFSCLPHLFRIQHQEHNRFRLSVRSNRLQIPCKRLSSRHSAKRYRIRQVPGFQVCHCLQNRPFFRSQLQYAYIRRWPPLHPAGIPELRPSKCPSHIPTVSLLHNPCLLQEAHCTLLHLQKQPPPRQAAPPPRQKVLSVSFYFFS